MLGRVTHRAARSCPAHGAASGAVDNSTFARIHLTAANFCPIKRSHLCLLEADGIVTKSNSAIGSVRGHNIATQFRTGT